MRVVALEAVEDHWYYHLVQVDPIVVHVACPVWGAAILALNVTVIADRVPKLFTHQGVTAKETIIVFFYFWLWLALVSLAVKLPLLELALFVAVEVLVQQPDTTVRLPVYAPVFWS